MIKVGELLRLLRKLMICLIGKMCIVLGKLIRLQEAISMIIVKVMS